MVFTNSAESAALPLDDPDDVEPLLGVDHAADLALRDAEGRAHEAGIGQRRLEPGERAQLLVGQAQRGGGLVEGAALADALGEVRGNGPGPLPLPRIPGGAGGGLLDGLEGGHPARGQAVQAEEEVGVGQLDDATGLAGLGLEGPDRRVGDHLHADLHPAALLQRVGLADPQPEALGGAVEGRRLQLLGREQLELSARASRASRCAPVISMGTRMCRAWTLAPLRFSTLIRW
jgi:hypothetical protein